MNHFLSKYGTTMLGIAGLALNLACAVVNNKNSEIKMKEAVAECVKEALKNQAKES